MLNYALPNNYSDQMCNIKPLRAYYNWPKEERNAQIIHPVKETIEQNEMILLSKGFKNNNKRLVSIPSIHSDTAIGYIVYNDGFSLFYFPSA